MWICLYRDGLRSLWFPASLKSFAPKANRRPASPAIAGIAEASDAQGYDHGQRDAPSCDPPPPLLFLGTDALLQGSITSGVATRALRGDGLRYGFMPARLPRLLHHVVRYSPSSGLTGKDLQPLLLLACSSLVSQICHIPDVFLAV